MASSFIHPRMSSSSVNYAQFYIGHFCSKIPEDFYTLPDSPLLPIRYKKGLVFLFLAPKSANLNRFQPKMANMMLSEEQLYRFITEIESLQAQVKELNEILAIREEELELLKKNAGDMAALKSELDVQLDEFHTMQNVIGEKQQQVEGAAERELELEQELTEAAKLQQLYNELLQEYAYAQAQLNDTQEQLLELNKKNRILLAIAGKVGEVESELANTSFERDQLRSRIAFLENKQNLSEF